MTFPSFLFAKIIARPSPSSLRPAVRSVVLVRPPWPVSSPWSVRLGWARRLRSAEPVGRTGERTKRRTTKGKIFPMGNEALLMIVTFAACAVGCAAGALLSFLFGKKRKKAIGEKIEKETAACDY